MKTILLTLALLSLPALAQTGTPATTSPTNPGVQTSGSMGKDTPTGGTSTMGTNSSQNPKGSTNTDAKLNHGVGTGVSPTSSRPTTPTSPTTTPTPTTSP